MSFSSVQQLSFLVDPLVAHMMIAIEVQGDELAQLIEQNKATANKVQTCIQQTVQQFQASSTHLDDLLKEIKTQNAKLEKTQGEEILELEKTSCELEATLVAQKVEEELLTCKYHLVIAPIRELQSDCSTIRTKLFNFSDLVMWGSLGDNFLQAIVEGHMRHYTTWAQSCFAIPSGCTMEPLIDYAKKLQNIKSLYPGDF